MHNIIETNYRTQSSKDVSVRILQLTDMHMSNSLSVKDLENEKQKFDSTNSDIVVLIGDIFDERTPKEDMIQACRILGTIHNTAGIYLVYGIKKNNDFVAITSSGVAGCGYPIKTGAPSEYV